MIAAQASWFDGPGAPLFGWWHVRADGARAVAILCGTIGDEQFVAHRAFAVLTEDLLARGLAVLRFDYASQGDSGDVISEDLAPVWVESILAAVVAARAAGAERVVLVGLRAGAILVTEAAARLDDLDALVLWDPWPTGASFTRHLRALHMFAGLTADPDAPDGSVEGPGTYLSPGTAAGLKGLALALPERAPITLVLTRAGSAPNPRITAALEHPSTEEIITEEQPAFLDVARLDARMPRATTAAIADWLDARLPHERAPISPQVHDSVQVVAGAVRESLRLLGPRHLVAVVAEPVAERTPRGTVLFCNTATTYHPGTDRLWVSLSRTLAMSGYRAVRFDFEDIGDSPRATSIEGPRYYHPDCVRDLIDVADELVPAGDRGRLAMVGLCSGSWAVGIAARQVSPGAVYLLNPLIWDDSPPVLGPGVRSAPGEEDGEAASPPPATSPGRLGQLRRAVRSGPLVKRARRAAKRALVQVHVLESVEHTISPLTAQGCQVTVVLGVPELERFGVHQRIGGRARIAADPRVRIVATGFTDHAVKAKASRDLVERHLPGWVEQDLVSPE